MLFSAEDVLIRYRTRKGLASPPVAAAQRQAALDLQQTIRFTDMLTRSSAVVSVSSLQE